MMRVIRVPFVMSHPPTSREEGEAGDRLQSPVANDFINHAYVTKPPLKMQKDKVGRASELVNTWRCWERDMLRERMEVPCPFSIFCPVHLFHLAVLELDPFIINW